MSHLLSHPLAIAGVCFLLCLFLLRFVRPKGKTAARWLWGTTLLLLAIGVAGPLLCADRHMVNLDEPTVISVSAAALHGQPLYTSASAGDRYSLLYGPVTYWVFWPPMLAHVIDLRFFQLWVILPLLGAGLLLIRIARRAGDLFGSGFALLPYAASVIMQSLHEWAMKGDAWLLLFFSIQLESALMLPGNAAVIVVALCAALIINIKVTLIPLVLLPLTELGRRLGATKAILAAILAAVFAVAPFLLPNVSAVNFIYYLRSSSHHGFRALFVKVDAELALFMALPAIVLLLLQILEDRDRTLQRLMKHRLTIILSIAACATVIFTSAKRGAGPWHLAPLAPMFTWLAAVLWRRLRGSPAILSQAVPRALLAAVVLSQCLLAFISLRSSVALHWRGIPYYLPVSERLVAQDLISIVKSHPGTSIQMGYGSDKTYEMTWERPVLVLLGNRYSLDADALDEADMADEPLPQATFDELKNCSSQIFLIPKGDRPFSLQSNYFIYGNPDFRDLFPIAFRQEFLRDYRKSGSSRYFDLWHCVH